MSLKNSYGWSERSAELNDAHSILEDLDKYRNLNSGVAATLFFVSAALGVSVFIWSVDLPVRLGIRGIDPLISAMISWIFLFLIWIFAFLIILWVLNAMGFRNVRSVAKGRLSKLMLDSDEVRELNQFVASRSWNHGRIFNSVIVDLAQQQPH